MAKQIASQRGLPMLLALGLATTPLASCGSTANDGAAETGGGSAQVGDGCVPADEFDGSFSGFDEDEVSVGPNHPACAADQVCLVNHFRGRVSCPYGQTQPDIDSLPGSDDRRCVVPGSEAQDTVSVPVRAQLQDRQPEDAVYCSCRCAGPGGETGAGYCGCPSGFGCVPLVADLGVGGSDLAGSYCVREGTEFDPTVTPGSPCDRFSASCGPARPPFDGPAPSAGTSTSVSTFLTSVAPDGGCLPRALPVDTTGNLTCTLIEATVPGLGVTCDTVGRGPLDEGVAIAVRAELELAGRCGGASGQPCDDMVVCRLLPASDAAATYCLELSDETLPPGPYAGYCYIDAMMELDGDPTTRCVALGDPDCIGNPELVADCPAEQQRALRLLSQSVEPAVPSPSASVSIGCTG